MKKLLKDYSLPLAMLSGALAHPFLSKLNFLTSPLIFAMLFLTFSKLSLKDIRLQKGHILLIIIQVIGSAVLFLALAPFNLIIAQGAMLCFLVPTATAAAVITGMLNGNVGFVTSYVICCNFAVALTAPLYFSFAEPQSHQLTFIASAWLICKKVFPLLILPLFVAFFCNRFMPKFSRAIRAVPKLAFWLWVFALAIVSANITQFLIYNHNHNFSALFGLSCVSLFACILQFIIGRSIGRRYADQVSAGQALGQKNTILAIWMANSFLNPITSLAPASYILWQNIINSFQLYRKQHQNRK
jgi:BASS family bile acid:Na+ symporter